MGSRGNRVGEKWNQMDCDEKSGVIQEEIKRVSKLPSNSVYAVHRLKVLNKISELLSVQVSCNHLSSHNYQTFETLHLTKFCFFVLIENIVPGEGVRIALHTAFSVKVQIVHVQG